MLLHNYENTSLPPASKQERFGETEILFVEMPVDGSWNFERTVDTAFDIPLRTIWWLSERISAISLIPR